MYAAFNQLDRVELTLYTDALIAHGSIRTRQRRVSDILNLADSPFVVLEDITVTDLDGKGSPITADVAQINLDAVLFAVVNTRVEPPAELRSPKMQRPAIISVPPFRVTGTLHLLAGSANLREALTDLTGRFLPVTDAAFEAPSLGLAPQEAIMLAVNHHRAQILAHYAQPGDRPVDSPQGVGDPWASSTGYPPPAAAPSGDDQPSTSSGDPWAGTGWSGGGTRGGSGSGA
jgi:hypothetical protein